ncbi:MAG TPA: hypothetical protein VMD03_11355 [Steroidobacteraceae bacterium]|nr:hypothetical protein [Steroidobacteraceae bacterium]
MSRFTYLVGILPLVLGVSACDVTVQDQTPTQFTANNQLGMYPIKAEIARDTLVSPDAVIVTAFVNHQPLALEADRSATEWQALYPIRCHDSFTVQFRAAWTVEGLDSRYKLVPEKPQTVRVIEPPLVKDVKIDTSARSRKGWDGVVHYAFLTEPNTQISSIDIEPVSQQPADVEAARPISVTTSTPVSASCGMPVDITLLSKSPRAHADLVIHTNNPSVPQWRTEVEFAPEPSVRSARS